MEVVLFHHLFFTLVLSWFSSLSLSVLSFLFPYDWSLWFLSIRLPFCLTLLNILSCLWLCFPREWKPLLYFFWERLLFNVNTTNEWNNNLYTKLHILRALGRGAFGEVYQGRLLNIPGEIIDELPVAVKTLPEHSASNQAEMDFLIEALIMSKFKHRYGIDMTSSSFSFLVDWLLFWEGSVCFSFSPFLPWNCYDVYTGASFSCFARFLLPVCCLCPSWTHAAFPSWWLLWCRCFFPVLFHIHIHIHILLISFTTESTLFYSTLEGTSCDSLESASRRCPASLY